MTNASLAISNINLFEVCLFLPTYVDYMNKELLNLEVVVIGAGLAGLVCAKELQQKGFKVTVLEKSRGVGGRIATRRLENTCFDHGFRYLENQGKHTQALIEDLTKANIIQPWGANIYQHSSTAGLQPENSDFYIAPQGMSAVAKFLATDLDIWFQCRVTGLSNQNQTWELTLDSPDNQPQYLTAKALVMAIPAPQAFDLIASFGISHLASGFIEQLAAIDFHPCLTVVTGYTQPFQQSAAAIRFSDHPHLAWICFDTSKRNSSTENIFVIQSNGNFAQKYLDRENLEAVAEELLNSAGEILPELNQPQWMVTHRWRYAFPRRYLGATYLATNNPLPLFCCGDWCEGNLAEGAINSGLATASALIGS